MARKALRAGLSALCLAGSLLGCSKGGLRDKAPHDPLLITKRPVEGRASLTEARRVSRNEDPPAPHRTAVLPRPSGGEGTPGTTAHLTGLRPLPEE